MNQPAPAPLTEADVTIDGTVYRCYYRLAGLIFTHLDIYNAAGVKINPGFARETVIRAGVLAAHHGRLKPQPKSTPNG